MDRLNHLNLGLTWLIAAGAPAIGLGLGMGIGALLNRRRR